MDEGTEARLGPFRARPRVSADTGGIDLTEGYQYGPGREGESALSPTYLAGQRRRKETIGEEPETEEYLQGERTPLGRLRAQRAEEGRTSATTGEYLGALGGGLAYGLGGLPGLAAEEAIGQGLEAVGVDRPTMRHRDEEGRVQRLGAQELAYATVPEVIGRAAVPLAKAGVRGIKAGATALEEASRLPVAEPRVLRIAAKPGAIEAYAEEGLAASRGAQRVVDPAGVRVLGEGEELAAGERELYHGTARPFRGAQMEPGTFLSPNADEAASYAAIDARVMGSTPPTPLQRGRQVLEQGEAAMLGGERGMVKIGGKTKAQIARERNAYLGQGKALQRPAVVRREVPPLTSDMEYVGEGLKVNPQAVEGLTDARTLTAQLKELRANPKGQTAEIGRLEAQRYAHDVFRQDEVPAAFERLNDRYATLQGTTPQARAEIEELGRIRDQLFKFEGEEGLEYGWNLDALVDATGKPAPRPPVRATPNIGPTMRPRPAPAPDLRPQMGGMREEGFRGEQGGLQPRMFGVEETGQRGQLGLEDALVGGKPPVEPPAGGAPKPPRTAPRAIEPPAETKPLEGEVLRRADIPTERLVDQFKREYGISRGDTYSDTEMFIITDNLDKWAAQNNLTPAQIQALKVEFSPDVRPEWMLPPSERLRTGQVIEGGGAPPPTRPADVAAPSL